MYNKRLFLKEFGQFDNILTKKIGGGNIRVTPTNPLRYKYDFGGNIPEYGVGKNMGNALLNLKNRLMRR